MDEAAQANHSDYVETDPTARYGRVCIYDINGIFSHFFSLFLIFIT